MVITVKRIMDTITIGIICMMRGDIGIMSIDKVRNTIENIIIYYRNRRIQIMMYRLFTVYKLILIIVTILAKLDLMTSNTVLKIDAWNLRGNDISK